MIELLENLKSHPPFKYLDETTLHVIEKSAQVAYYPEGTILVSASRTPDVLYFIIKGRVEAVSEDELIDVYHSNDDFGGIELIENRASEYNYKVTEELICYEIPKMIFLEIAQSNEAFKNYFFYSIAERIDLLREKKEFTLMSDIMISRVDEHILRKGTLVPSQMPITEALRLMEEEKTSCLIVENREGYGIITDADLRHYILYREKEGLEQVRDIQSYPIITAKKSELLFNILLKMTEHSIKHLPLIDEKGLFAGVVELIDLLSYFSNQSYLISVQMDKARDLQSVVASARRVPVMIEALHSKGVKSRYIAKLVSEINKKMYQKIFDLVIPGSWHSRAALILLGSEGRSEQIMRTDQDNALIFEEGFEPEDAKEVTERFIGVLDEIGFPRCSGGIMVINEKWRKSLSAYKSEIDSAIEHPDYERLMDLAILFDAVAVAGKSALHDEIKTYLIKQFANNRPILAYFAKAIETFESPLGLFSRFVSKDREHKGEIDIKKGALFALVHGCRALALEYGISATNTSLRIKELNNAGFMDKETATELMEALEVLHTFRLHAQIEKSHKGSKIDNYISVEDLSKLERDLLKDALKSVDQFRKLVAHHFHLSIVG
ncbi:MAG: CBS domain-containing protein [Campylobacterales bacterium]|nr:CBS domain-containing protein [Campylobacterales bacterium]